MAEKLTSTLNGLHVLVVEDDYMIATDLAVSLKDLGVSVLGPAGSVADALALLAAGSEPDAAVLDVNLGAEKVFPVADALQDKGVPFVFATGYDHWIIPKAYAHIQRFEKPINVRALARALSR
jgi:CheY-like chemotaxis protein